MNIFLAIVMGPALGFMLYALCQFWLEERRLRKHPQREAHWSLMQVTSIPSAQRQHVSRKGTMVERNVICDHSTAVPPSGTARRGVGAIRMQDFIFVVCTVGFFAVAVAYVWACDRLK